MLAEAEAEADDAFSEDCLTLNIWTKPQVGESKKAVLIWIYGGGFTSGYAGVSLYNGQYLAESEDVVVVSIKYVGPGDSASYDTNEGAQLPG